MSRSHRAKLTRQAHLQRWVIAFGGLTALFALGITIVPNPPWAILLKIAVFLSAVGTAVLSWLKLKAEERALESSKVAQRTLQQELDAERVRTLTTTQGVLGLAAKALRELAAAQLEERRQLVHAFRVRVVQSACELVKSDSPRASYYRLKNGPPRVLSDPETASRNRVDEPTTVFVEGNEKDQDIWTLLDTDDDRLVRNTNEDAPAGFDKERARRYRTYIASAVVTPGLPFGVLTINAPEPGELSEIDRASMRVLARMLATAEVLALGTTELNRRLAESTQH
jgi:hypothetical protein